MKEFNYKNRIVSMDVLRVILAIMVIALHVNNSNMGKAMVFTEKML